MSNNSGALLERHLKPLEKHLKKAGLIELCINGAGGVWLETNKGWQYKVEPDLTLSTLNYLAEALATLSGQSFSDQTPLLSTHLPNYGYRVQALGGSLIESGFAVSIRCGSAKTFPLESYFQDMEDDDDMEEEELTASDSTAIEGVDVLHEAIRQGKNVLISGGTNSGKTSFINSLIKHIDSETRIITIEDTKELNVPHSNSVRIIKSKTGTDAANISYKQIINACMRLRPDRIILGEIDIENTVPFLRLLNTGHSGCMSSVHANGVNEAIEALVLNAELAGLQGNIKQYALQSLDLIVHIKKKRKRRDNSRVFRLEYLHL